MFDPLEIAVGAAGWLGAVVLLAAYGLASAGRLPADGIRFQLMNLAGAAALTVNTAYHGAWPSAALNVVWIIIGLAALRRARRRADKGTVATGGTTAES